MEESVNSFIDKMQGEIKMNNQNTIEEIDVQLSLEEVNTELSGLIQKMKLKNEGEYVVNLFGNDAVSIRKDNGYKPLDKETKAKLQSKTKRSCNLTIKNPDSKMTKNNYDRVVRQKRELFLQLDLQDKICVMLTLNTNSKEKITYDAITKAMDSYSRRVKRAFNNPFSIKRYEYGKRAKMLHVHYLLFFDTLPKNLTEEWAKRTWKLSNDVNLTVFDKGSLALGYISKFQNGDVCADDDNYVEFPEGSHFIAIGKNIPRRKDISTFNVTAEDFKRLYELMNMKSILEYNQSLYEYDQKNKFIDMNTGEIVSFINKRLFY